MANSHIGPWSRCPAVLDHQHMGQIAHPARTAGRRWPALLSGVALVAASPLLSGCGSSLSSATTTLAGVLEVQVVHPDGSAVPGIDGLRLHRGDVVRTGSHGRAELHTRGRVVYVGSLASVQVRNGAEDELRRGAVVVDAQSGPGLTLDMAALTVDAASGTATRAERDAIIRIGALAGEPAVGSDTGRQLQMSRLSQAIIGGDSLPDTTAGTPLHLTDDDGEAHAVPSLVRDDLALNDLAAGIDATGSQTFRVVTAAWHRGLQPLPAGVLRSEQVLPVIIAAAGKGADAATRYREAVSLRQAGGSWGVIAHLLGTTSAAVADALQAFEHGAATGQVGSVPAALAFVSTALPAPGANHGGGTSSAGAGSHSGPGSSSPSASPSPTPSGAPGVVTTTIDKVLSLLPTPVPTPTTLLPTALPTSLGPVPVPSLPNLGGLSGPVGLLTPVPLPTLHP